jgi:hypothetical protein
VKLSFAEFKAWHDAAWPPGYIWSGYTCMPDGRDIYADDGWNPAISDTTVIDLSLWEGLENETGVGAIPIRGDLDLAALIRKWRKARDSVSLVVTVPRGDADELRALAKSRRWMVL